MKKDTKIVEETPWEEIHKMSTIDSDVVSKGRLAQLTIAKQMDPFSTILAYYHFDIDATNNEISKHPKSVSISQIAEIFGGMGLTPEKAIAIMEDSEKEEDEEPGIPQDADYMEKLNKLIDA